MDDRQTPQYWGQLRSHAIKVPKVIGQVSGISVFGRTLRSFVFTTDVAIIRNINADAVIAVYPFTPQPAITQALMSVAERPLFCGVGGGITRGTRVRSIAEHAEHQGVMGVVVNAPTPDETIRMLREVIDVPIVVTVVSGDSHIKGRLDAGAAILNVSAAARTPEVVAHIRKDFPNVPIIATGGPTDESILRTIEAGANAITYTPPSTAELMSGLMDKYRL